MSLSERFSTIRKSNITENSLKNRKSANTKNQRNQRTNTINAKRGLNKNNNNNNKTRNNKSNRNKVIGKVRVPTKRFNNIKNGKGKKTNKDKDTKKSTTKVATKEDLDMEMDKYWHSAGKGPDPEVAKLDRELDDYQKSRTITSTTA